MMLYFLSFVTVFDFKSVDRESYFGCELRILSDLNWFAISWGRNSPFCGFVGCVVVVCGFDAAIARLVTARVSF